MGTVEAAALQRCERSPVCRTAFAQRSNGRVPTSIVVHRSLTWYLPSLPSSQNHCCKSSVGRVSDR
jgi:hypothetical protein